MSADNDNLRGHLSFDDQQERLKALACIGGAVVQFFDKFATTGQRNVARAASQIYFGEMDERAMLTVIADLRGRMPK
jgi:hypothetical protein